MFIYTLKKNMATLYYINKNEPSKKKAKIPLSKRYKLISLILLIIVVIETTFIITTYLQ